MLVAAYIRVNSGRSAPEATLCGATFELQSYTGGTIVHDADSRTMTGVAGHLRVPVPWPQKTLREVRTGYGITVAPGMPDSTPCWLIETIDLTLVLIDLPVPPC